jgi:hypothetical protein
MVARRCPNILGISGKVLGNMAAMEACACLRVAQSLDGSHAGSSLRSCSSASSGV